jgi:prepilin signal peptidase PulO-like enzyme (type II secretory pathway)
MLLEVFSPYFVKVKDAIMRNWLVRDTILSFYALWHFETGFLSILIFVIATFLGNFVGVEWYTIHLFDIFTAYPELTNIFKAILNNFKKLALLSFLAGVFILVFNVVSLNTYTEVMWEDDLPE